MGKEGDTPAAAAKTVEWRVNMPDGTSRVLVSSSSSGWCRRIGKAVYEVLMRIWNFIDKAWKLGKREPRKVIHGFKVGLALSLVSLFYYMRPLYDDVGGNAMWAVMTVVVVFEYTVGATLSKCVNRTVGTFVAVFLGIGVHWVAAQSGKQFQPIILQLCVFLLAGGATFSRFIPSIKARFDYGCLIFILTFSLVSVSGYRVDKLMELGEQRVSTIAIGTSVCIFISMALSPVWAGQQLHSLITNNLENLSLSLEGCVTHYDDEENTLNSNKKLQSYKCVLNTKASEESMVNFAVWEPGHGPFNFRHPWKQYLKIGASMRHCASCIHTLHATIINSSSTQVCMKKVAMSEECMRVCSTSAKVLRDLANMMKDLTQSSIQHILLHDMNSAVEALQVAMKILPFQHPSNMKQETKTEEEHSSDPNCRCIYELSLRQKLVPTIQTCALASINDDDDDDNGVPLMEIAEISAKASLLVEIASRIEVIVKEVNHLAKLAEFRDQSSKNTKQSQSQQEGQNGQTHF